MGVTETVRNSGVVHGKSQKTCNQCSVCPVAFTGGKEGTVEEDICLLYRDTEQLTGNAADLDSACGVRA